MNKISFYGALTALSSLLANTFNKLPLKIITIILGSTTIYEFIKEHHSVTNK